MLKKLFKTFFALALLQTSLLSNEINIDKILKNAHNSNKEVMLYLHRVGCSYCNSMQEFTLEDDDVAEYLENNFQVIQINISHKDTYIYKGEKSGGICLAKRIGYDFYPSALFLDDGGDIKYASVGYNDDSEFLVILHYIYSHSNSSMKLDTYKEKIGFQKSQDNDIIDPRKHEN